MNFLPVQTDATEASIKLLVSCEWSDNSRDLPINLLKGRLNDRGLLVIENKLNLVLNNKRTLVQVPIYFSRIIAMVQGLRQLKTSNKKSHWRKIYPALITLKNKLVFLCF